MIENLTKENFWNKMKEDYPKAMEKLCAWIDKYKEENNWDELFNNGYKTFVWIDENHHSKGGEDKVAISPKYHELPIAFQIGIFDEFIGLQKTNEKAGRYNIEVYIEGSLSIIEEEEDVDTNG